MNKQKLVALLLLFTIVLTVYSCTQDVLESPLDQRLQLTLDKSSPNGSHLDFILPQSDDFQNIPQDPKNPITAEKVALGNLLFFETGLALAPAQAIGKGSFSCGSCHVPSAGFMPGRQQGIADGGIGFGENGENRDKYPSYNADEIDAQGIRPLTQLNVAFVTNTSWNGQFGANGVNENTESLWSNNEETALNHHGFSGNETQNIAGLDLHRMVINKTVLDTLGYTPMYDAAFPDYAEEDRYSIETTALALSSYTRTLFTNEAPFQNWLKGEHTAMTDQEKKGALLFFGKAGCNNCHTGPALSSMEFAALGVEDLFENGGLGTDVSDKKNLGRGGFTGRAEDMFKFRVPQLYNLKNSPFYFHGSSHHTLRDVVQYFNLGIRENNRVPESQISQYFHPLSLSDDEVDDITAFISGGLYDSNLDRYVPESVLSGNCIPNNDPFSQIDLGCE